MAKPDDLPSARPERPSGEPPSTLRRVYAFLVSPKLAIALLVVVLACSVAGVTVVRGVEAGRLIFATLWFNGLLVLLAVSSGATFFTRIWRRKLTLVSGGMILFHLCFVVMLGGIVVNGLVRFRGVLRLTEGETLQNSAPESYDEVETGRFFDPAWLRGETTLVRTHVNYQLEGENKHVAYEVAIDDGEERKRGFIYATQSLVFDGVRYFRSKEGYSVLVVLLDKAGQELYGLHIPLQSYRQPGGSVRYATGSSKEEGALTFPGEKPRFYLSLAYRPGSVGERTGHVTFTVTPLGQEGEQGHAGAAGQSAGAHPEGTPTAGGHPVVAPGSSGHAAPAGGTPGEVAIGGVFDAGDVKLSAKEIRYWVGMEVRYDPGLPVILGSLCFGLLGMVLTFVGRLRQGPRKRAA